MDAMTARKPDRSSQNPESHRGAKALGLPRFPLGSLPFFLAATLLLLPQASLASRASAFEVTQRISENQVRKLIEPVLEKYCHDECKLLGVAVSVDLAVPDEVSPGFDDIDNKKNTTLAPSSGRIKLLIDEKLGPITRTKILDLLQQYLDTLDYPIKVDTQIARFPQPSGAEGRVMSLREKISKQFNSTLSELLTQFCPKQCLVVDFNLKTEPVNVEEANYGATGEFFQEGDSAIRVKDLSATLLIDENLPQDERTSILEMAKLKTSFFKNVNLTARSVKFPKPSDIDPITGLNGATGRLSSVNSNSNSRSDHKTDSSSSLNSLSKSDQKSDSKTDSTLSATEKKSTEARSSESNTTENKNLQSTSSSENATKQERYERIEKIERVENGDAVQAELQKFKVYGLVFACSVLSLLIFIAVAGLSGGKASAGGGTSTVHRVIQSLSNDATSASAPSTYKPAENTGGGGSGFSNEERNALIKRRYEIENLIDELTKVFSENPKVAKQVFTRILTEEGVEVTAQYIYLFSESIVVDMLRDPSLQSEMAELMEFYAKNPIQITDEDKLDLLRKLHNRTVAGKLLVFGNRSTNLFDFLAEMDGMQIVEMIRAESLTVKSIVLTQCDNQKRVTIYSQLDEDTRMKLLTELSRIDYLPRNYIYNVANALKRKRRDNPKLNTEALPGSEVLVSLLEKSGSQMQQTVVKALDVSNPESARVVKAKLVSLETLRYLRDGQLLEVVLSLKHDELLQFLKGAPAAIRNAIFSKSPKDLVVELEEELNVMGSLSREAYNNVERKVLNRMRMMANEGLINLIETNERMFADIGGEHGFVESMPAPAAGSSDRKAA
jgi:flagellar motor switch protein FliG